MTSYYDRYPAQALVQPVAPAAPLPEPACWGVMHGSGVLGWAIRRAELEMTRGDEKASWAGHCVVYIGQHTFPDGRTRPAIVQAEWPRVIVSPVPSGVVWASGQPLSGIQRAQGVTKALSLVGTHYDPVVYGWYLLKVLDAGLSRDLGPLFADARWGQVICSGVMVQTQVAMGVDITGLSTAAIEDPDFTSPADAYAWGLAHHWMAA